MNFNEIGLPAQIVGNLSRLGILTPTEIQQKSIPIALGGIDILASSKTGSGKTLAYLLPAINKILTENIKVLVLVPTRELAMQVSANLKQTVGGIKISSTTIIGGEAFGKQVSKLRTDPKIIVATPGRLIDHLKRATTELKDFNYLVLDEMDRMLDMGMKEQIAEINKYLPQKRQVLMFSATMPNHIHEAARQYLKDPHKITVGKANQAAPEIEQEFISVTENLKYTELDNQLKSKDGTVIVFVKTKRGADKLAKNLKNNGHKAEPIHGDLAQGRRTRVLNDFRGGRTRILVATDVVARGLDIDHVKYVFNYDLPSCPEDYLHRIGRTGRAGAKGFAISFVSDGDIARKKAIEKLITKGESTRENFKKPSSKSTPFSDRKKKSFGFKGRKDDNTDKKDGSKGGKSWGKKVKYSKNRNSFVKKDDNNPKRAA